VPQWVLECMSCKFKLNILRLTTSRCLVCSSNLNQTFHRTASNGRARIVGTAQSTNARTCYIKVRPFAHGRLTNQNVLVHLAEPDRSAPCLQCRTRYEFLAQAFPCESVRKKSGLFGGREAALSGEIVAEEPTNHPSLRPNPLQFCSLSDTLGLLGRCPGRDSFCSAGEVILVSPSPQCPQREQNSGGIHMSFWKNSTALPFLKRIQKD
jgi:hypothetical protein